MNSNYADSIVQQGLLPLFFHPDQQTSIEVVRALYDAGIRVVEYTNRGPEALKNFQALVAEASRNMPDMTLALGTVLDAATARTAIGLGAAFIISPGFVEELAVFTASRAVLWIPGCMTPSEIMQARSKGIRLVKLFPGNLLTPDYMRSIRDLFPDMQFMPTGGVEPSRQSVEAWFSAGVSAVGMGSTLITREALAKKDFRSISSLAREVIDTIAAFRHQQ